MREGEQQREREGEGIEMAWDVSGDHYLRKWETKRRQKGTGSTPHLPSPSPSLLCHNKCRT